MIRDAAYDALPKATRAELHERFADWLDEHGGDLVERDEIVGYHLEQAHRYRQELGTADEQTRSLGERAARRLATAGRRASLAATITRPPTCSSARWRSGSRPARAASASRSSSAKPSTRPGGPRSPRRILDGDDRGRDRPRRERHRRACACPTRAALHVSRSRGRSRGDRPVGEQAIETLKELGDTLGLAVAEQLLAARARPPGPLDREHAAHERALVHAEASGDRRPAESSSGRLCANLCNGPTPVDEAIRRLEELLQSSRDDRVLAAVIGRHLAASLAMAARFDEAREHLQRSSHVLDELDHSTSLG